MMVAIGWTFMCPEPYVCTCEDITFNCTCGSRQNITVSAIYNFDIRHILIKGCGTVFIPMGSMFNFELASLELDDLEQLNISPFALAGLQGVEILKISNIQNMNVDPRGFSGLYNISSVSISNVTWENMKTESFGGVSSTENFTITDSKFVTVESLAFIIQNVTRFYVKNCNFGFVENMSLLVHSAKEVSFEDCAFHGTSYTAFSMSFVEYLSFKRCSFGVLSISAIFAQNVGSFALDNCFVNTLETHAFRNVDILNSVSFSNNTIHRANENSLYFNRVNSHRKAVEIDIRGNILTCDCNLTWLWENETDVYKNFIENSFCSGSSGGVNISLASLRISSEPDCLVTGFAIKSSNAGRNSSNSSESLSNAAERVCSVFLILIGFYFILMAK